LQKHQVALVTGASRGIGAAVAEKLASRGFDLVVNYRNKARRAEQVVESIKATGREAIAAQADLTSAEAVAALIARTSDAFGELNLLVLNASGGLEKDAAPDYAMQLNLTAQVNMVEAALPIMPKGSRIVFVTSHLAHYYGEKPVYPEYEVVAASKKQGEIALRERIPALTERGIDLIVVSGDIIEGTITPQLLDRLNPGLLERRRDEAGWLPTVDDFAEAIATAAVDRTLASGATIYVGSQDWEA
jgi:NAD(P)-dependent dehydrogenase (short-subunit alcohol dehydrogenase family)